MDCDDVRGQGADEPLYRGRAGARSRWLDDGIKRGSGQRPEALVDLVNSDGDQMPPKRRFQLNSPHIKPPPRPNIAFSRIPQRILPDAIDLRDEIAVGRLHMEKKGG